MRAGEEIQIGALTVRAVPAEHDTGRLPFGARAEPLGYVIEGAGRSVYFAGDTDVFAGMAELAPVDVALLPIWGWGPTMGPGHMDPGRAAEAAALLGARLAIPIHWGTYYPVHLGLRGPPGFLETPPPLFEQAMREHVAGDRGAGAPAGRADRRSELAAAAAGARNDSTPAWTERWNASGPDPVADARAVEQLREVGPAPARTRA